MISLINYAVCTLIIMLSGYAHPDQVQRAKLVSLKGGHIEVDGSTNINKFSCGINNYLGNDTLMFQAVSGGARVRGDLVVDVNGFDCKMKAMTADLLKTLKESRYPHFYIRIRQLDRMPSFQRSESIAGNALITLAGATAGYDMNFNFTKNPNGTFILSGKRKVKFSDFKIIPPSKVGGMIKTNQELEVQFKVLFFKLN